MDKLQKALARADRDDGRRSPPPLPDPPPLPLAPAAPRREEPRQPRWPDPTRTKPATRREDLSIPRLGKASEALRLLRAQVLARAASLDAASLLVTSARPREGKTFTALRLATCVAEEGRRVAVLVDANLKAPSLARRLGVRSGLGLSEYLVGMAELDDVLIHSAGSNLCLVPGGRPTAASADLLETPRMSTLLSALRVRWPHGFFIFDGPSLASGADAVLLSLILDAVLLVVEGDRTSEADLLRAAGDLGDRPVVGIAYNKSRG